MLALAIPARCRVIGDGEIIATGESVLVAVARRDQNKSLASLQSLCAGRELIDFTRPGRRRAVIGVSSSVVLARQKVRRLTAAASAALMPRRNQEWLGR